MSLTDLVERKKIPAFVRFERRPVEDKEKSIKYGRYIAKDVDYAIITSAYSKDNVIYPVDRWLEDTERKVRMGTVPLEWFEAWKKNLEIWKQRQSVPTNGTPIRGWGVISPAQQETIISLDIYTVEDLIRSDKLSVLENGRELKQKAVTWLQALNERGPLVQKLTLLETENERLKATVKELEDKLKVKREEPEEKVEQIVQTEDFEINIEELLAPHEISEVTSVATSAATNVPPIKRRGRPPKVK